MCKNNVDGSEWICIQMCSNYVSWIWVKCFDLWCRENMTLYIFMPNVIIMRKILQCRTLIIVCAYANLLILWFVWPTLNVYALSYTCIYMCVCVCVWMCVCNMYVNIYGLFLYVCSMYAFIYVCVCMYVCMYVCMFICIYVCMYVCL